MELEDEVRKFYFDIRNFLNIAELIDENYVVYAENGEDGLFRLKLFCVNPAVNLGEYLKKGRSAVFFSATLLPMSYYRKLLSNRQDDYGIYVESPFSQKNRCILNAGDVSSLYSRRGYEEYHKIAEYIAKTDMAAQGKLYGIFSFLQNVGRGLCSLRRRIFCKLGEVYLSEQLYEGTGKRRVPPGI